MVNIREQILSSKLDLEKVELKLVGLGDVEVELRQFTLYQKAKIWTDNLKTEGELVVNTLIELVYEKGTENKVFLKTDRDFLLNHIVMEDWVKVVQSKLSEWAGFESDIKKLEEISKMMESVTASIPTVESSN